VEGLTELPAHRLAAMVRAREVSAVEVLAAHLETALGGWQPPPVQPRRA
jgi:Asp-tRNA(Asn)/Glu-tRNA(Gln) amidotransferase A subunit family amidase